MFRSTGLVFGEKPSIGIEPTNLPDRSRYGNDGLYTTAPTDVQLPSGLWVRDFASASSQYITIADKPELSFGNESKDFPFSVYAWVNYNALGTFPIVSKGISAAREYNFFLTNGTLRLILNDNVGGVWIKKDWDAALTADVYTFVAGTYTGSSAHTGFTLYKNGSVEPSTGSVSAGAYTAMHNQTGAMIVGRTWVDGSEYSDGKIALLHIVRGILSAGQIAKIFNEERHWFGV